MGNDSDKKNVWIIGATSGIGLALARLYAEKGCRVLASGRTKGILESLADEGEKLPGDIMSLPFDITKAAEIKKVQDTILKAYHTIDIAIISSGVYQEMPLKDLSPKTLRDTFAVNTFGVADCLSGLFPVMKKQGRGQIGVISSVAGYRGLPRSAAYGASKAAITHFCEALLPEARKLGIDLKVISPGFIKTPLVANNDFPMPFMITAEKAAHRIYAGMQTGLFEITFPKRFTWGLKLLRILPYGLYNLVTRHLAKNL